MELQKRNLIVLGRTGVGKSTVVNQILGKNVFPVSTSMEGVTRGRRTSEEETEIETKDAKEEVEYKIKIIDTVGLQDVKTDAEMIMKEIQGFISRKDVHLIFFVMRKGVFFKEEKKTFESIMTSFKKKKHDISGISALIVTGCEGLSDEGRKDAENAIENDPDTKSFAVSMGKGIYPVGFPSVDNLKQSLREEYVEGMKRDTEELRKLIFDCSDVMTAWQPEENITSRRILVSAALVLGFAFLVYDATYGAKYSRGIFLLVKQYIGLGLAALRNYLRPPAAETHKPP